MNVDIEKINEAKRQARTVGEMIAAGEIGPDSPATRGELERVWRRTDRLAAQIEDLEAGLKWALERIAALEHLVPNP